MEFSSNSPVSLLTLTQLSILFIYLRQNRKQTDQHTSSDRRRLQQRPCKHSICWCRELPNFRQWWAARHFPLSITIGLKFSVMSVCQFIFEPLKMGAVSVKIFTIPKLLMWYLLRPFKWNWESQLKHINWLILNPVV